MAVPYAAEVEFGVTRAPSNEARLLCYAFAHGGSAAWIGLTVCLPPRICRLRFRL
jgi:hypothetical protein